MLLSQLVKYFWPLVVHVRSVLMGLPFRMKMYGSCGIDRANGEDWSICTNVQIDLSLRFMPMEEGVFPSELFNP